MSRSSSGNTVRDVLQTVAKLFVFLVMLNATFNSMETIDLMIGQSEWPTGLEIHNSASNMDQFT